MRLGIVIISVDFPLDENLDKVMRKRPRIVRLGGTLSSRSIFSGYFSSMSAIGFNFIEHEENQW